MAFGVTPFVMLLNWITVFNGEQFNYFCAEQVALKLSAVIKFCGSETPLDPNKFEQKNL